MFAYVHVRTAYVKFGACGSRKPAASLNMPECNKVVEPESRGEDTSEESLVSDLQRADIELEINQVEKTL